MQYDRFQIQAGSPKMVRPCRRFRHAICMEQAQYVGLTPIQIPVDHHGN